MKYLGVILFCVVSTSLFSQVRDTLIDAFLNRLHHSLPKDLFETENGGNVAIDSMTSLISHENERVRRYVQFKIHEIGFRSKFLSTKRKAVNSLFDFSFDQAPVIRRSNSDMYQAYPKEAYTTEFIVQLKSILHNDSFVNRGHILLAGFLELTEEKDYLDSHFVHSKGRFMNDFSLGDINRFDFAARMALARMGDAEQGKFVINKIMDVPESEVLLKRQKYLAYIKQPEAVEILIEYLFKGGEMDGGTGMMFNYPSYVMWSLYISIAEFPIIRRSYFGYTDEEISIARNWITAHRNTYKINLDTW